MLGQDEAARLALDRLGAFDRPSNAQTHSSRNLRYGVQAAWPAGGRGDDGAEVSLGGARPRALLALLLLHPTRRSRPTR